MRETNWKCSKSVVFERLFVVVRRKVNGFCKEKELLLPIFTLSDRRRLFRDAIRTSRRAPQGRPTVFPPRLRHFRTGRV